MTQKLKISFNTQKFAQSSLEERFGSESGRIQLVDIFNSFHTLRFWKLKKFTQKLKISVNNEKFAKSSLEETFGSESGRIQVFDIFNSFHALRSWKFKKSLKNWKFPSTLKSLHKVHLKNVSEVKVEEFKFLIFLTHS